MRVLDAIESRVLPALNADIRIFQRWARAGLVRPVDFRHLMFTLWVSVQACVDEAAKIAILLGKPPLEAKDDKTAERVIAASEIICGRYLTAGERRK